MVSNGILNRLLFEAEGQSFRLRSRVIPLGGRNDPVNQKGLDYYVKLADDLLAAGIIPMVTLYHWDLPDALEKRYGGLLNKKEFVADYTNYARIIFTALPKVKHWVTFNEPWCSSIHGYSNGQFAPGHTSDRNKSLVGDSSTEPWIVGHNILVAHGSAVQLYRNQFKPQNGGEIGITLNGDWVEPWDPSSAEDIAACERRIEFAISWFADPIYLGKYPDSMTTQLGERLPTWDADDLRLVHGSNDFYGMNHYCANYIKHLPGPPAASDSLGSLDALLENKAGESIGPVTQSPWLRPYSPGFRKLLKWLTDRYGRPKIIVTENGTSVKGENDLGKEEILDDEFRAQYFRDYIKALVEAYTEDGVNVKGYMAWSLME